MGTAITVRFRSNSRLECELLEALRTLPRGGSNRLIVGILKEVFGQCDYDQLPGRMEELAEFPSRLHRYSTPVTEGARPSSEPERAPDEPKQSEPDRDAVLEDARPATSGLIII